ncbi:MAG: OmpA family protein [Oceanococcus sp.]
MKGSIVGLLAASALVSGVSHAEGQSFDDRIYGGLLLNYVDADNTQRQITDSKNGVRALVGKRLSPLFALEGTVSYNKFGAVGAGQTQKEGSFGVDALAYPLKCTGKVSPFIKLGLGGTYFNEDETALNLSIGGGLDWAVSDNGLKLRTDVALRYLDTDKPFPSPLGDGPTEPIIGVGLLMPFGKAPSINDGCAVKKAMPAAMAPAAAAPAPAGPSDSDGDGVVDANDKCPNTPAGTKVDVNGCPVPETVVIYFAFDSAELNSAAQAALDRVAANLVNRNFVVAIANGHADSTGTEEYNMSLSERRANAVATYMASKGVEAGQVRQRAYGETRPAASGDTEIGRAKNRRVEINLLRQ